MVQSVREQKNGGGAPAYGARSIGPPSIFLSTLLTPSILCSLSPISNSIPDGATRCKAEWGIVRSTWARRADLPSGEAGMYALFVGELFAWACVGEIVGRGGTFGGYQV